jgi:hypothetical protein
MPSPRAEAVIIEAVILEAVILEVAIVEAATHTQRGICSVIRISKLLRILLQFSAICSGIRIYGPTLFFSCSISL